jgi:hypothetical protein
MPDSVEKRLDALPTLSKAALCDLWKQFFHSDPSSQLRRNLMIPILAYRIQEQGFGSLSVRAQERLRFGSPSVSQPLLKFSGPSWRPCGGTMMTGHCRSIGYWREALFIASATHGEIPCAAKGWQTEGITSTRPLELDLGISMP